MPTTLPQPQVQPQPERAGVVGSPQPVCIVCGEPREPSKREACSNKCRAALTRQRQAERRQLRDGEILALLEHAERLEARAAELRTRACQLLRS
jgi:predicted nucleic acid-binding Zn ribbon protein